MKISLIKQAIVLIAALIISYGCGGGGLASSPTLADLVGTYEGTFLRPDNGDTGSVQLVISPDGTISGSCIHSRWGTSSLVAGEVNVGGKCKIYYQYPTNDPEITIGENHDQGGRLSFTEPGRLTGILKLFGGDFNYPIDYDLTKL